MKRIIISPLGHSFEFDSKLFFDFHCRLFAILAGIPKKVTVICDDSVDFNEVYKIEYI